MRKNQVLKAVSETLNMPIELIKSRSRKRDVVDARRISLKLIRTKCGTKKKRPTLISIGNTFSGIHHSSILHSLYVYDDLFNRDREFTDKCNRVLEALK